MDIKELDKKLQESLHNFTNEAHARPINHDMRDKLDGYDYDELCRQFFYVMDDFRQHIIKYLESQKK